MINSHSTRSTNQCFHYSQLSQEKMERRIGVVLLLHIVILTSATNETLPTADPTPSTPAPLNQTDPANLKNPEVNLSLGNSTLDMLFKPAQGDGTNKKSVPKKGIEVTSKPRKGVQLPNEPTTTNSTFKSKPLASETQSTEDEVSVQPDYTALIVGLSLGIALVLILASVTYWRLRDVWERRQYKRVDFLIDGLYTDT